MEEMKTISLFDGLCEITVPICMNKMDEEIGRKKYPNYNMIPLILTNNETTVDFNYFFQKQIIPDSMLEMVLNISLEKMKNVLFGAVLGNKYEDETYEGDKIVYREYIYRAADGFIFNTMFFVNFPNGIFQCICNCRDSEKENWKKIMLESVKSVKRLE